MEPETLKLAIRGRRRFHALMVGFVVLWTGLALRLFLLQVMDGPHYRGLAQRQQQKRQRLLARRGRILDRHLTPLVDNVLARRVGADPRKLNVPKAVPVITAITGEDSGLLRQRLATRSPFVWLARGVTPEQARALSDVSDSPMRVEVEVQRHYPLGALAGSVIGFTDVDGEGIEGIEAAFDAQLAGRDAWRVVQRNGATGEVFASVADGDESPRDGDDIVVTLDARYQAIVEAELAATVREHDARGGVAVFLAPATGEILAMAQVPNVHPSAFELASSRARRNRSITDGYEPGSTFKLVTAAAALESGRFGPSTLVDCHGGQLTVGGDVFHDHHPLYELSFQEVFAQSSNLGMISAALKVGARPFYLTARQFGFGHETGLGLPGEAKGILREPTAWSARSLPSLAIGQEVLVTPLQLACAYAVAANGGKLVPPRIVRYFLSSDGGVRDPLPSAVGRRVISEATARELLAFMRTCVASGTGRSAQVEGLAVGGKTGTAQKSAPGRRGYLKNEVVVSFVGICPLEAPRMVGLVVIDEPRGRAWGGTVAAPAFRRMVRRMFALDGAVHARAVDSVSPVSEGEISRDRRSGWLASSML